MQNGSKRILAIAVVPLLIGFCCGCASREHAAVNPRVSKIEVLAPKIEVAGLVERPGFYVWHEGITVGELLEKVGLDSGGDVVCIWTGKTRVGMTCLALSVLGDDLRRRVIAIGEKVEIRPPSPRMNYY